MRPPEQSLSDLVNMLWQARLFLLVGGLLGLAGSMVYAFAATPLYRAEMIVAPADGYALGDYASSSSVDRSISLPFWRPAEPEGISTDFYRFIYTVQEPSVAAILMKDKKAVTGVRRDSARLARIPSEQWKPSQLSEYFHKRVKVEPVGATVLRRLSYTHPDPEFAADMLRKMHLVADQMIRRDRRRHSQSRVDYLQQALAKTTHPDHRVGITRLLMQQEHIQMLANMDEPYAAIIVEPPSATPRPVWPRWPLLLSVATLMGMAIGFFTWSLWREKNEF